MKFFNIVLKGIWFYLLGRKIAEYTNPTKTQNTNLCPHFAEFLWKTSLLILAFKCDIYDRLYSLSKPVEMLMGSDTKNIIYTLFNTILSRIQQAIERQNERGSGFTHFKD